MTITAGFRALLDADASTPPKRETPEKHGRAVGTKPTRKEKPEKSKQGRDVELEDPEPWAEPVDGVALLAETAAVISRYVILSGPQADAAALWTGAAHAIDGLERMPMLLFSSPVPECGKTTAATTIGGLVPRLR